MTVKEILKIASKCLKENNIDNSFNISRVLLANVLKVSKEYLIIHDDGSISREEEYQFDLDIKRIIEGYPIQYITHNQEFMKLNFYVDENVLIPQPDTEVVVEEVLKICDNFYKDQEMKILDLCTGSGVIAVSISKNTEKTKITASDISDKAISIAKMNANNNNVNIAFLQSNLFEKIEGKFDIIVSNPPYIKKEIIKDLPKDVQNEPMIALDGGIDGLDFYRNIAQNAYKFLRENGYLVLEIGYNQKEDVIKILNNENEYNDIRCIKDYSNNDRVIVAKIE